MVWYIALYENTPKYKSECNEKGGKITNNTKSNKNAIDVLYNVSARLTQQEQVHLYGK